MDCHDASYRRVVVVVAVVVVVLVVAVVVVICGLAKINVYVSVAIFGSAIVCGILVFRAVLYRLDSDLGFSLLQLAQCSWEAGGSCVWNHVYRSSHVV